MISINYSNAADFKGNILSFGDPVIWTGRQGYYCGQGNREQKLIECTVVGFTNSINKKTNNQGIHIICNDQCIPSILVSPSSKIALYKNDLELTETDRILRIIESIKTKYPNQANQIEKLLAKHENDKQYRYVPTAIELKKWTNPFIEFCT